MATNGFKKAGDVDLNQIVCLEQFEELARNKLDSASFKFLFHGADEEVTCKWNHQMIVDKFYLKPRILRNVKQTDTTKLLFGQKYSMPIGIAPTGMQKMFDNGGEMSTAQAASNLQVLMILSQFSTTSLEDIAEQVGHSPLRWQNIYMIKDRDHTMDIIRRAIDHGYGGIVITCDAPVFGHRRESALEQPDFKQYELKILNPKDEKIGDDIKDHAKSIFDESRTWDDIGYIKKRFGNEIKIIIKGIMTAEDAKLAMTKGIDGIYISNHGGRQLDGCSSTIEALCCIVRVVKGRIPVLVDGGFRTGSDVLKALALGADMVLLGRPILYSLSAAGEAGVEHALKLIQSELKRCMQLCGCTTLSDFTKKMVSQR